MDPHRNNVGFLRLAFACFVIVGHAPEMADGNRMREPLTMIFHTVSLGELSVDAFFLLSGYLITNSMFRSESLSYYLQRRVMRIYPAFIVAYLISVFGLGWVADAEPWLFLPKTLFLLLTLQTPMAYPGQFPGMSFYPMLNGSMWTISHEFHCYLLVGLLGVLGLLVRRYLVLALTGVMVCVWILTTYDPARVALDALGNHRVVWLLVGNLGSAVRLTAIFLVGSCFLLFRQEVMPRLRGATALGAVIVAAVLMYRDAHFAETALVLFGGAALFWLAFKARLGPLQRINDQWDVSYGVYLYGWPTATYIRWVEPSISPWLLAGVTLPIAFAFGAASWWGVEKWTKGLMVYRGMRPAVV